MCYVIIGKLEFVQTEPGPGSHLSLPYSLPDFQSLLLDVLPGAHPQLPDGPPGGGVGGRDWVSYLQTFWQKHSTTIHTDQKHSFQKHSDPETF